MTAEDETRAGQSGPAEPGLPRMAAWLARRLAPGGEAEALIADLRDEYGRIAAARGARAARTWLTWELTHALRPFAGLRAARARTRLKGAWTMGTHGLGIDIRHALRRLARTPGFTGLAVATLAIGIGATSSVFSVAYALWLRPLPFGDPAALVALSDVAEKAGAGAVSGPELDAFRAVPSLAATAGYAYGAQIARIDGEPARVVIYSVSNNLFDVLGVRPAIGRDFTEADAGTGALILSDAAWRARFGRDPAVLRRTLTLSGRPFSVVGVMPPGFQFPLGLPAEAWMPASPGAWTDRGFRYVQAVARLAPGRSIQDANRELQVVAARLAAAYPDTNRGWTTRAATIDPRSSSSYRAAFGTLLGIVGLFLMITSVNLAGLLLARNTRRRAELAVCLSLGARHLRLGREIVIEALALAAVGGFCGVVLSSRAARVIAALLPAQLPGSDAVGLHAPVVWLSVAVSLVTALVCGLVSAAGLRRLDAAEALAGGRTTPASHRLQRALVVSEVALATILLVGAALMTRSLSDLINRDRGFDPHGLAAMNVTLPFGDRYADPAARAEGFAEILHRIGEVPGVRAVGATTGFPGSPLGSLGYGLLRVDGRSTDTPGVVHDASPDYFTAMRVPLRAGRVFGEADRQGSPRVAIVSESLARALWPVGSAIGRSLLVPSAPGSSVGASPYEVVGVVGDLRGTSRAFPDIFVPLAQAPAYWVDLVVRTDGDPAALREPVRRALRGFSPDLLIENVSSLDAIIADATGMERAQSAMAGLVAVLSTLVAGLGLYALLSQIAAQRTRELGIRLALGSDPRRLFGWMLGQGMALTAAGLAGGAAGTFVTVRLFRHAVFGLGSFHLSALALAAAVLAIVSAAAAAGPAWRVMRTNPLDAMRQT